MTNNELNRSIAIHATESALRDAESDISELTFADEYGFLAGEFSAVTDEPEFFDSGQWNDANSKIAKSNDHISSTGAPARTMSKLLGRDVNADTSLNLKNAGENSISPGITNFRVTARGLGGDTRAEAIIQTYVGARIQ